MNLKKGFTLIELLVVIAIIGILASVVLASLNSARTKGKDASAKTSITSVRAQSEIFYNGSVGNNSYGTVGAGDATTHNNSCTDAQTLTLFTAANTQTGHTSACEVGVSGATYAAAVQLNDLTFFCVDSSGFAGPGIGDATTHVPTFNTSSGGVTGAISCI